MRRNCLEAAGRLSEIVVVEAAPWWLPELRRQARRRKLTCWIRPATWEQLADASRAPVGPWALVTTGDAVAPGPEALAAVAWLGERRLPWAAILTRRQALWEWPLRALGATSILADSVGGERVFDACLALLAAAEQQRRFDRRMGGARSREPSQAETACG